MHLDLGTIVLRSMRMLYDGRRHYMKETHELGGGATSSVARRQFTTSDRDFVSLKRRNYPPRLEEAREPPPLIFMRATFRGMNGNNVK